MPHSERSCQQCGQSFVPRSHFSKYCDACKPPKAVLPKREQAAAMPVTETPEFKHAIKLAIAEALGELPQRQAANEGKDPLALMAEIAELFALKVGDLTNQNSGQKLVSPEVLASRAAADREMRERIARAVAEVERGDEKAMPRYRLLAKIIAPLMNGDEIVEPMQRGSDNILRPTELDWLLPPNLAMSPINGPAKEIFALFKASIGNQVSVKVGSIAGKGAAAEPVFDESDEQYLVTHGGRLVTTGSATQQVHNAVTPAAAKPLVPQGKAAIRGQDPMRQNNGPPTIQVRVLGTIAPPAIQNG